MIESHFIIVGSVQAIRQIEDVEITFPWILGLNLASNTFS